MADDDIRCPKCNAPNPSETVFCGKCGAGLLDESAEGAEERDPLLGSFVGDRFLVHEKLGEGGMGVVYRAEQTAIKRPVALKVLHPHLTRDENLHARFHNEAAASSRLNHPNTITVYDFGQTESKSLYIAMEYIQGLSLDDEIRLHGAMDWRRTCHIGVQICGSLQDAHDNGIVHRDLKPENVMLSERGGDTDVVKVLDFGIAKIMDFDATDQRQALTQTGMVFGTPQYMSPEQIRGEKVDHRSDIYSVGVILYQMLVGELPFLSETPMGLLTKHLMDPPRPFAEVGSHAEVPVEIEEIVGSALAKDRDDRPQSMKELGDRLAGAAGLSTGSPTAASAVRPAGTTESDSAAPTAVSAAQGKLPPTQVPVGGAPAAAPKKGKGKLIGILVVLLLLLGGGGASAWYFLVGPGKVSPQPQPQAQPQTQPQPYTQPVPQPQTPPPYQVGQTQPVPAGQDLANLPATPAPLPAIPTGGNSNPSTGGGGTSGGGGKPSGKAKDVKCGYTANKDPVAGAMLASIKYQERGLKKCVGNGQSGTVSLSFTVAAGQSKASGIRSRSGTGMESCLKGLLGMDLRVKEKAARNGTVKFDLERKNKALKACSISVSATEKRVIGPIRPTKPTKPSGGKKPGKTKSDSTTKMKRVPQ